MKHIVLILVFSLVFFGCKKQAMEDVYAESYPEEQYPSFMYTAWWGYGTVKNTDILSLVGNDITGHFMLSFEADRDPRTNEMVQRFYIRRVKPIPNNPDGLKEILESASFSYQLCKSNIVKIDRIFFLDKGDHNDKWDNDILGYWLTTKVCDNNGVQTGGRMMRLDKQKFIDL